MEARLKGDRTRTSVATGDTDPARIRALLALARDGRYQEAEELGERLRTSWPRVAPIANALGAVQRARGKITEARKSFERALAIDPEHGEAHNNLGRLLLDHGDMRLATDHLLAALLQTPGSPSVLTGIGLLARKIRKPDEAEAFFQRALKADTAYAEAAFELGRELLGRSRFMDARNALKKARSLGWKTPALLIALAKAEEGRGNGTAALEYYDRAIEQFPDHAPAYAGKAILCQHGGDFASAETLLRKAIELRPTRGEHYRLLSASHRFRDGDPLIDRMLSAFEREGTGTSDRMELGFALSKAMEDCAATDRVFGYLRTANRLMGELHPYDIGERISEVERVKAYFEDFDPNGFRISGRPDFAPIFVTGLPRSGTTLVEQILSSHSTVEGAGEFGHFSQEAARLTILPDSGTSVTELGENDLRRLGKSYLSRVRERFPKAVRVTDKSIQTFLFAGLVRLALPNAKIVLVRRNPRDNLYSIYKNRFPEGTHLYSYDFDDLASYYRTYVDIVDFWLERMPDCFHQISYDRLIADPVPETGALLEACDLEWEDGCLEFHRNRRAVTTLSVYQVRQPIYSSSVNAWKKHETELRPLFDRLDLD